ncbi:DUF3137 domain-containing protein [Magnetovibrio sp. PR-2]|uniref:DUF3137 domain-containing protein n=1 Tax=Magnetovibrio sp. PR-2 TaxID=3120356 RepID=UPI002FCE1A7A
MLPSLEEIEHTVPALRGLSQTLHDASLGVVKRLKRQRGVAVWAMMSSLLPMGLSLMLMADEKNLPPEFVSLSVAGTALALGMFGFGWVRLLDSKRQAKITLATSVCAVFGYDYREKPSTSLSHKFARLGLAARYEGRLVEDEISGTIDGRRFVVQENLIADMKFSPLYARVPFRRTSDVFHGLIGVVDYHHPMTATTIVSFRKNRLERWTEQPFDGELMETHDPDFDAVFEVHSTSLPEARRILSPAWRRGLLALNDKFNTPLAFAFQDAAVWFTVHRQNQWMEMRTSGASASFETYTVQMVLDILRFQNLIQTLPLSE